MHWSDLQSKYSSFRFLCFAGGVDSLVKGGWEVVPVAEKRKVDQAGLDDNSDPFISGASKK
jgi:hypothetical protein